MYKKLSKITALLLFTIALIGTVLAVDNNSATTASTAQPITLWGQVAWTQDGDFLLENNNLGDSWRIQTGQDSILFVDAITGAPLPLDHLRNGDIAYVYTDSNTTVVIGNIPMGFGAPTCYVIDSEVILSQNYFAFTAGNNTVTLARDMTVETYDSHQLLCPSDLTVGHTALVWHDQSGTVSRMMVVNP